jgi:hypothetical protein
MCTEASPTAAEVSLTPDGGTPIFPVQLAAGGGRVMLGAQQRTIEDNGVIVGLGFASSISWAQLTDDFRNDYSLVASDRYLVYFAASGPRPVTTENGVKTVGLPPGEWVARDLTTAAVTRLGMKSYGGGVALRDGTFVISSLGEDGPGPAKIWSWNPATNHITELLTSSFTTGRVPSLITDGIDVFAEDDGEIDHPTWRLWKIDLANQSAALLHDEPPVSPGQRLFLGADREALYLLDQSPPSLHVLGKTGETLRVVPLDLDDGKPFVDALGGIAEGGVTEDMIYLTSRSRQTMFQLDKRTGARISGTPAPTKESIWAHAVDGCYVYFSSGEVVSRVPRARPAE